MDCLNNLNKWKHITDIKYSDDGFQDRTDSYYLNDKENVKIFVDGEHITIKREDD